MCPETCITSADFVANFTPRVTLSWHHRSKVCDALTTTSRAYIAPYTGEYLQAARRFNRTQWATYLPTRRSGASWPKTGDPITESTHSEGENKNKKIS